MKIRYMEWQQGLGSWALLAAAIRSNSGDIVTVALSPLLVEELDSWGSFASSMLSRKLGYRVEVDMG